MPRHEHEPEPPAIPIPVSLGPRWHLVRTVRHHEDDAQKAIIALGLETYLPREQRLARYGRKLVPVSRPLFRQYLFTRFDLDCDPWGSIRRAHFVAGLISVNEVPVRVPDQQLDVWLQLGPRHKKKARQEPGPVGMTNQSDGDVTVRRVGLSVQWRIYVLVALAPVLDLLLRAKHLLLGT